MEQIIKPIPEHHFHNDPDSLLSDLIKIWRRYAEEDPDSAGICLDLINDAYKILGYRCALEYIKRYEPEQKEGN